MGWIGLRDYQREAVDKMKTGCIFMREGRWQW